MKKRILSMLAIFILLFTNYAFAYTEIQTFTFNYERKLNDNTIPQLNSIAKIYDGNTRFNAKYNAITSITSQNYNNKDFSNQNGVVYVNKQQSNEECDYKSTQKIFVVDVTTGDIVDRYVTIKLSEETKKLNFANDEFYIIYKNAITYDGNKYDLKLQLNSIACDFTQDNYIYFHVGSYRKDGDNYEILKFFPGVGSSGERNKVEIDVTQTILDNNGQEKKVSGLLEIRDIDLEQGLAIENLEINADNVYMRKETENSTKATDTIKYYKKDLSNNNSATYIYSTTDENFMGNKGDVYVLINDSSKLNMTYTFGTKAAHSTVGFSKVANYYKIDKIVSYENEDDTTTSVVDNINAGTDKIVTYSPKADNYYLKRIKVDGEQKNLDTSIQNAYIFENINSNHIIEILYAKKVTVQFNSKGGTSVPTQTLIPGNKAFEPAQPTRSGYTFKGWYIDEAYTTPYDFNNPVNEDKVLYAKWEEIKPVEITHNIKYEILGTPKTNNITTNPTSYKEGTTTPLTIKDPTLEGYTFSGWFENPDLTGNPISTLNVANRNDDIILYGKWIKDPEPEPETAQYKVNHYLEDKNGTKQYNGKTYKLDEVNSKTLTGTIGDTVTATSRVYAGYIKQQESVEDTVLADGSTTLDLYYNKINYTITFDSKGGTEVDNQTKNYEEKVDEPEDPTKDGYKFLYWYEEKDGKKVIYDFDTPVTADKNLIAEWEEIKIIPDNPQEEPKKEETIPTQKTDTTVAKKIIPNTGVGTAIFGAIIAIICAFFGIRYFKLRKDMK